MTVYVTDGQKSIPLSSLRPDAWGPVDPFDQTGAVTESAQTLAGSVPVLYRCIDIRANAVAGVPYRLEKAGKAQDGPEIDALRERLARMLWLAEAGLCFKAAYWELSTNRAGRNLTPYWLSPWTITPDIRPDGLHGFYRSGGAAGGYLVPDKVMQIWNYDPSVEIGPGRAPVEVVLSAAGLLSSLDRYARGFFERGGVKMTLLSVPPTTAPEERKKLKTWWEMMTSGVSSAFKSVVVSTEVKPTVIGSDPKETAAPELSKLSREDVMVGLGVPQSLVFSNPLAGGTVDAERLNFYDFTILPRLGIIWPVLNERYLTKLGLRAVSEPEKLEVYQASELRKAQGLMAVTGEAFYLPDEARAQMGKEPRAIAQQKMDMAIAEQRKAENLPTPPPEPTEAAPAVDPETLPPAEIKAKAVILPADVQVVPPSRFLDLARWETKALKRPGRAVAFAPDALSTEDAALIGQALLSAPDAASIKAVFAAYKAEPGIGLSDDEKRLYDKLRKVLATYEPEAIENIVSGGRVDLSKLEAGLRAALLADLTSVALSTMGSLAEAIGPDFDPAQMASVAGDWARGYTFELVKGLTDTTRTGIASAVASFSETPGMTSKDVARLLAPLFGQRRAETIAITEITRASAQAQVQYRDYLAQSGLHYDLVWRTASDERTCPICVPRNGATQGDGWDEPPPGHPRCRCAVSLQRRRAT